MTIPKEKTSWLDRPAFPGLPAFSREIALFALILLLAAFSRLVALGERAVSHDETSHIFYAWQYARGLGYAHTPVTHGPFQFHLIALSFLFLGDSEYTARLPHALASILAVLLLWNWRAYLGRAGALCAALLLLISPYMLYYGRYARNEAFVAVLGLLTLFAILRYLEQGKMRYLLLLTIATALHFTVKETAFIYTAQALLYLAFVLLARLLRSSWRGRAAQTAFQVLLPAGIVLVCAGLAAAFAPPVTSLPDAALTSSPATSELLPASSLSALHGAPLVVTAAGLLSLLAAAVVLVWGFGWERLRRERSFDLLVLLLSFSLPQLSPLVANVLGWDPLQYTFTWPCPEDTPCWGQLGAVFSQPVARTAVTLLVLFGLSALLGCLWDRRRWFWNALAFWIPYTLLYTSLLTNWQGFFTGTVGSLGYWLAQQGVERGGQPWYYYAFLQLPLYEFLPLAGTVLAGWFALKRSASVEHAGPAPAAGDTPAPVSGPPSAVGLLFWWAFSSLAAYSLAGEKMPWLTVHIVLPMILLAGWGLAELVKRLAGPPLPPGSRLTALALVMSFLVCLLRCLVQLTGTEPPFQGKTLAELAATGSFLLPLALGAASLFFFLRSLRGQGPGSGWRLAVLATFLLLAFQTTRAAVRAAYQHPDEASEYLVYAHSSSGVTVLMDELARLSARVYGETDMPVAYDRSAPDSGVAWPFQWYLRSYPRASEFSEVDTDLLSFPAVIVDQRNAEAVAELLGSPYVRQDFLRMVWPNQDYFGLTVERIRTALTDARLRSALWQIWLNRDFTEYGLATGETHLTAVDWEPSDGMSLFLRRDLLDQIWEIPTYPETVVETDPYLDGQVSLQADLSIGSSGSSAGLFNHPHGLSLAPDGSLYVADTDNHRIQHFSPDGTFLGEWGSFAEVTDPAIAGTSAPIGTFNQPWAVAASPDGRWVYVLDTWNNRLQKFTPSGEPVSMWGYGNSDPSATDPLGWWGPRGLAVDVFGRVFIADTGNKRILVFDADGSFLDQIGSGGMESGFFEEPVGLAVSPEGRLYVADTWNQRVQVFFQASPSEEFLPVQEWPVSAWYGDALENKPYLAVDGQGRLFLTDPPLARVVEFDLDGSYLQSWGELGDLTATFQLPSGIAADGRGVWVADAAADRVLHFTIP